MSLNETTDTKPRENHLEDDLRLRSLRDANRSPSPEKRPPIISTRGHYLWQNRSDRKYKSQIHPMKTPDVVRYVLFSNKMSIVTIFGRILSKILINNFVLSLILKSNSVNKTPHSIVREFPVYIKSTHQ